MQRSRSCRALRLGEFDVLVGINLLREGLDLPEVSLVSILDADKEGFLRSETSLIQMIGRAARNVDGQVVMYADRMTNSMTKAIGETQRRRLLQIEYNGAGIDPQTIRKAVGDICRCCAPTTRRPCRAKIVAANANTTRCSTNYGHCRRRNSGGSSRPSRRRCTKRLPNSASSTRPTPVTR